jgi:hypothetical protein
MPHGAPCRATETKKPPPVSWLDAVSRAFDAPTNSTMTMQRDPAPTQSAELHSGDGDRNDKESRREGGGVEPTMYVSDEELRMSAQQRYAPPVAVYERPVYGTVPVAPMYMEHPACYAPAHGYCERCAQRDYDRYYDRRRYDSPSRCPDSPRRKRNEGGGFMGMNIDKANPELMRGPQDDTESHGTKKTESPEQDKPDNALIWKGTTWDTCSCMCGLFMWLTPVRPSTPLPPHLLSLL